MSFLEKIKAIDYRYKIILGGFIIIFTSGVIGALISEMKTVVDFISTPFVYFFTTLHPVDDTADFWKICYASLCILFYLSIIVLPFASISAVRNIQAEKQSNLEIKLYSEEIAAAVEVLERPNLTPQEQEDVLEDFLRKISNNIFDSFQDINMANVRYAFLLSQPDSTSAYSAVKLGRNGLLKDDDNKVIEWILTNTNDDFFIDGDIKNLVSNVSSGYDMNTVGLIRNNGNVFRFGFVIFFQNSEAFASREAIDNFIVNSSAIRVIAYMDKLWNSMVHYSYNVTGGGI